MNIDFEKKLKYEILHKLFHDRFANIKINRGSLI